MSQGKVVIIVFVFLLCSIGLSAQALNWQWASSSTGYSSTSDKIAVDASGNSYVVGSYYGTQHFGSATLTGFGGYVAKMNSDGVWQWVQNFNLSFMGSPKFDIVLDGSANIYITGTFTGATTFGTTTLTSNSDSYDAFVAKLNTSGAWQWAMRAGGAGLDNASGITIDGSANVYIAGSYTGNATFGTTTLTGYGNRDIFVAKLNTSGAWQWAVKAGGTNYDYANNISFGGSTSLLITGSFSGTIAFGAISLPGYSNPYMYVAKLNTSGVWQWAVKCGGSDYEDCNGIAVDVNSNAYITGSFSGWGTFGSQELISDNGADDIFVAKLNSSGTWQWVRQAGGSNYDYSNGIALDSSANVYITGEVNETASFGTTSISATGIYGDVYVAKLNSSGTWQWVKQAGDSNGRTCKSIAVVNSSNIYLTGGFSGYAMFDNIPLMKSGSPVFVAKLSTTPSTIQTQTVTIDFVGSGFAGITVRINGVEFSLDSFYSTLTVNIADGDVYTISASASAVMGGWMFNPESYTVNYNSVPQTFTFVATYIPPVPEPVIVYSDPPGADVYINGNLAGITPYNTGVDYLSYIEVYVVLGSVEFDFSPQTVWYIDGWTTHELHFNHIGELVTINSEPPGAGVFIEMSYVGTTPYLASITEGGYLNVSVSLAGWSFLPSGQFVNYAPIPQELTFTGTETYGGTYIDPNSIPTEWVLGNSPYVIYQPITIGIEENITIEDGVVVNLMDGAPLIIYGNLTAEHVTFRPVSDATYWEGLSFAGNNRTRTNSRLTDCYILDATTPITIEDCNPIISNVQISLSDSSQILPHTGIIVRGVASPVINNVKITNYETGINLGSGVSGTINHCTIEKAGKGIVRENGNQTEITENQIINCELGIKSIGPLPTIPLKKNTFILKPGYVVEHPTLDFRALEYSAGGTHLISNNTSFGYPKALNAVGVNLELINCVIWCDTNIANPFVLSAASLITNYNDIRYSGGVYPGIGNRNSDPLFIDSANSNFHLSYNSPCIDTGNPLTQKDSDSTSADIGAFEYPHKANFSPLSIRASVGSTINFTNTSIGHSFPNTIITWDLNDDGTVESNDVDWSHQFTAAGVYDLKLKMTTGSLVDSIVCPGAILIDNSQPKAPQNVTMLQQGGSIVLSWAAVTETINELPANVNYYIVYKSSSPFGVFEYMGNTSDGVTQFTDETGGTAAERFYFIIGFEGNLTDLQSYIANHGSFPID